MTSAGGIRVQGLHKAYGGRVALDGLDLTVRPGTVHGLLGPNGAGKTTLLRVLLGLVRPDSGEVTVEGVVGGFVEVPGAYGYLTGRQNLQLLADLDDHPADVDDVLVQVGLTDRADSRVSGWSLGMRQRLGIAAGLLRAPDVLVLDEPASGLDPVAARQLRQLVKHLGERGLTVLLCSHDLADVDALCQDVTVVLSGRTAWTGPVAAVRTRPGPARLSTSDDDAALQVPAPLLSVVHHADGGLLLNGPAEAVDAYVLALGDRRIVVRELTRERRPLEQAFLELVT